MGYSVATTRKLFSNSPECYQTSPTNRSCHHHHPLSSWEAYMLCSWCLWWIIGGRRRPGRYLRVFINNRYKIGIDNGGALVRNTDTGGGKYVTKVQERWSNAECICKAQNISRGSRMRRPEDTYHTRSQGALTSSPTSPSLAASEHPEENGFHVILRATTATPVILLPYGIECSIVSAWGTLHTLWRGYNIYMLWDASVMCYLVIWVLQAPVHILGTDLVHQDARFCLSHLQT